VVSLSCGLAFGIVIAPQIWQTWFPYELTVRLFCELFLVAVLIWLGWTKSFHDRIDQIRGVEPTPAPVAQQTQAPQTTTAATATTTAAAPRQPFVPRYAPPRPASTPSGAWMWDPAHRGTLDRPSYKTGDASAQQQAQQYGQSFWIDAQGVRHSTNATPPPGTPP
jgi:hypothetical protein